MSENTTSATKPVAKKTTKKTATEKVASESKEIVNSAIEEAKTKTEDGQTVITAPEAKKSERVSNSVTKDNGVIGSRSADRSLGMEAKAQTDGPVPTAKKQVSEQKKKDDRVLIWSKKNARWQGVGAVVSGYNLVTKEAADKWLTRDGVRKASPEEVATYYGK